MSEPTERPDSRRSERSSSRDVDLALKDRALESAAEGITITDASLPDNPLIYANAGFENLTGYSAEEVMGRNCRFLQGPESDPVTVGEIRRAIQAERECTVEILNYRKDGSTFWNRLSITPVRNDAGEVTHFIGVQSDVTKRRRAEEELRAANLLLEAANERVRRELIMAAQIQQSLLPPEVPKVEGYDFAWKFRPSAELAGDTLNILPLDARHLAFYLLDVSGHGVSAALLSVTLSRWLSPTPGQSCLYQVRRQDPIAYRISTPVEVAEQLNRQFEMDPRTAQYFTIYYSVLDIRKRELRYVSAGHPPAVFMPRNGEPRALHVAGFPIGLVPEPRYEEQILQLSAGDRLFLYTDGITEAADAQDREFGLEGLVGMLARNRDLPLEEILEAAVSSAVQWSGDSGLRDDVSMLAVAVTDDGE